MHRVVVFMGGSRDALAAVQRALPASIKALAGSGVVVPRSGRSGNRSAGFSHQSLAVASSPDWTALEKEVDDGPGETVLLVISGLIRLGGSATRRSAILRRLSAIADDVCLVSAVGDQLTMINDAYLSQVSTWRMSKRLDAVLPRMLENAMFVHERVLRPWYDDSPSRYAAVPLGELLSTNPVAVVLRAAGVPLTPDLPVVDVTLPARLGTVGVEASRLLSTYLRAEIPDFDPADAGVATANRAALARAEKLGWCSDRFWGWSRRSADRALAQFVASNHRFARAVWGTDWMIPYPLERPCTRLDFLDLDAQVVDQIQRYVMANAQRVRRERRAAL